MVLKIKASELKVDPESEDAASVPINVLSPASWAAFVTVQSPRVAAVAAGAKFAAKDGQVVCVPDSEGNLERVLFGLGDGPSRSIMNFRGLAAGTPSGDYKIASGAEDLDLDQVALAWALGVYRFDRYKRDRSEVPPRLAMPGVDRRRLTTLTHACAMARDMINTPANDMGPRQVEAIARELAQAQGATIAVAVGEALIEAGYPAVHAVGRAASAERAPRMIEMVWGENQHPLIALIGKGVVFDSGGLDIKPSAGMRWMKKDMGGAAHALALARMIMESALPVRLCVLLPVVENAIAGDAMRPGDVLASRKGLSIEVGNTDAEGRLILADALARAAELDPTLTIDLATLTGAARVALGPEVIPFYTDDDGLAAELEAAARSVDDPIWRMPLWDGYAAALDSDVADVKNDADAWAQAGSVTAALFLKRFAPTGPWVHFDIFAWNPRARPGWPQGAEVQAIRAIFAMLEARYR
jgi:leucyl aminopeptidase